jgi:putative membrane protein
MQFLKTLFWVVVAVVAVLFGYTNWQPVTLKLWGGLEADVKLPVLVFVAFLLGFVPTFIVYRARLWSLRRRFETQAQAHVVSRPAPARPVAPATNNPDRHATDAKAWPAE